MAPNRSKDQVFCSNQFAIHGNGPVVSNFKNDQDLKAKGASVQPSAAATTSPCEVASDDDVECESDDELLPARYFDENNAFHYNLASFDHSMRCKICKELMNVPVSLPCLHSFCSECVRSYFKRKLNSMKRGEIHCPQCHCKVKTPHSNDYEKAITSNKELEGMLDLYKQIRGPLRASLVRLNKLERERKSVESQIATGKPYHESVGKKRKDPALVPENPSPDEVVSLKRPRRGDRKRVDYAEFNEGSSEEKGSEEGEAITNREAFQKINYHNVAESMMMNESRPPKTKPNYHIMKRKQLVELCRKENLSTSGSDVELKKRHEDWILLYNSECDSAHPRPVHELLNVLKAREAATKMEEKRSIHSGSKRQEALFNKLQKSSVGGTSKPSSGEESFDALVNKNYQDMIRDLKERKQKEKLKMKMLKEKVDDNDDVTDRWNEEEKKESNDIMLRNNATMLPSSSARVDDSTSAVNGMNHVDNFTSAEPVAAEQSSSHSLENSVQTPCIESKHRGMKFPTKRTNSEQSTVHSTVSAAPFPASPQLSPNINVMPPTVINHHIPTTKSTGFSHEYVPVATSPNPSSGSNVEMDGNSRTHSQQTENETSRATVYSSSPGLKSIHGSNSSPSSASKGSIIGPWSCSVCTFFNEERIWLGAKCEMCDSSREMEVIDVE